MQLKLIRTTNNGKCHTFDAIKNHQTVGYCQIRTPASCADQFPPECKNNIYYEITEAFRGKGLGTELMALAIKKAKALGIENIKISCEPGNIASLKVIAKMNTVRVGSYLSNNGLEELIIFDVGEGKNVVTGVN